MLTPESMTKFRIFCTKTPLPSVVEELYSSKAIDIKQHRDTEEFDVGKPLQKSDEISNALVKARSLLYGLKIENTKDQVSVYEKKPLEELTAFVTELASQVNSLKERQKQIDNEISQLDNEKQKLTELNNTGFDIESFQETRHLTFHLGYVKDAHELEQKLDSEIQEGFSVTIIPKEGFQLIALFNTKSVDGDVLELLRQYQFNQLSLPVEKDVGEVQERINKLENEKQHIGKKLENIKHEEGNKIASIEKVLASYAKKAEAPLMFAESQRLSIITGWVPSSLKQKFRKNLEKKFDRIFIEELEVNGDEVPVKTKNPASIKPYEELLRMFSYPSYREIDPTLFIFFTFPLFFGFMLGDVGYGIVTFLLFFVLKQKVPAMKSMLNIMLYSSVSTIIFGLMFGEFFGFYISHWPPIEHLMHSLHIHYPIFHRGPDSIMDMIVISLIIGFIHVNFGLILGFVNALKKHGLKDAIFEKVSWMVLEAGAILIALGQVGLLPVKLWQGLIVVAVAGYMIFKGEGLSGIVEIPSVFIHIGSYLRLMAIGLASVSLAAVINNQTMPLFQAGPVPFIFAIILFAMGHVLNIALGVLGPFLHSLRLHYVELFTKFYEGGGREYQPFGQEN